METNAYSWDVKRLIADLGGPRRVGALMVAYGIKPVEYRLLQTWSYRGRAPADGVATLMALARQLWPGAELVGTYLVKQPTGAAA